jgi:hypothetical protein
LHSKLSRRTRLRTLLVGVPAAALACAVGGSGLAAAAETPVAPVAPTDVIKIVLKKGQLKFEGPTAVHKGDQLEIVNQTDPKKVGPHTFSLVTQGSVPKTKPARQSCFTPNHICMSIAKWHGFQPKTEKITVDPAKAGADGWSTLGSVKKKGDSWFTEKKNDTISQEVSAAAPPTLYYICAVHPWMHGKVKVEPALLPTPIS